MGALSSDLRAVLLWLFILSYVGWTTAYKPLADSFPSPNNALDPFNGTLLAPLLTPRVPGTPGQTVAQNHIASYFRSELPQWNISWQNSTSTTPVSGGAKIPFANLIVRREPPWTRPGEANLLTLVAHYDSKYAPQGFVGATDSAVPVAVIMWVAKVVDEHVSRMYREMSELGEGGTVAMDMGIQILFLDGEEAFQSWTDTDSLYGARYATLAVEDREEMLIECQIPSPTMGLPTQSRGREVLQIPHPALANLPLPPARPARLPQAYNPLLLPHNALGLPVPLDDRVPPPPSPAPRIARNASISTRCQYDHGWGSHQRRPLTVYCARSRDAACYPAAVSGGLAQDGG
jgi:hypothetical protein